MFHRNRPDVAAFLPLRGHKVRLEVALLTNEYRAGGDFSSAKRGD